VQSHDWRRYAAPAAFLAAVTVAVVLIRAGLESGSSTTSVATTTVLVKRYYRVHAGDTFAVIAHKTGVSVKTIERLNPKVRATSLHIGERLRVQ